MAMVPPSWDDLVAAKAKVLYDRERRLGWDPAWVNAHPRTRAVYEDRAEHLLNHPEEEHEGK